MTGYLGYHPDRVLALRRALATALDGARGVRCDDPLAAPAVDRWRRAVARLTPWESRLVAVTGCAFDSPYRRVGPDVGLPVDLVRPVDPAWTVVTDPLWAALPALDLGARAEELAALLVALPPDLVADDDATTRMADLLGLVVADAAACRRLLDRLGPGGFAAVARALAAVVATSGTDAAGATRATRLLQPLAAGLGRAATQLALAPFRAALLEGPGSDTFTAALVLRYASLPAAVTAAWAVDIVRAPTDPGGLGTLGHAAGQGTHELVLGALTADPAAGRQVLRVLDDLDLLIGPHADGDARGRFLLAATDRSRFDPAATVVLLERVLTYLHGHDEVAAGSVGGRNLRPWLGRVVGPWMVELAPVPGSGDPAAEAGAVDRLAWVANDAAAAEAMVAWLPDATARAAADALRVHPGDRAAAAAGRLDDVAARLGVVVGAIERGAVERAAQRHEFHEAWTGVLGHGVGQVVAKLGDTIVPGSSALTGVALGWLTDGAVELAEERDWVHEPPTAEEAAVAAGVVADRHEAVVLASAIGVLRLSAAGQGRVPAGTAGLPAPAPGTTGSGYVGQVVQWARAEPAGAVVAASAGQLHDRLGEGRERGRRPKVPDPLDAVTHPGDPVATVDDDAGRQQLELQGTVKGVPGLLTPP